ncbi:tRNA (N6-threonylcarbamoyladenosine(37)-N6)-methyltransferase TrmO [Oceanobacter mangrovi]|uniref:tRNA (N6-threonylcarbamoyladenosine(37)-N6)-methyltransferase TrmO n=1 Tax=Oceanobacter mangrovi TaxID=2862510 RepID=UPI001C8DC27F|nr:tRNA (N6-threonylcarbamoyladenosine(37)-N6)-methyltransferase TrmO [Oceanobacter mangrovi]
MNDFEPTSFTLNTIAIAHTPFQEKFAVPRQPRLAPAATGYIELLPPYDSAEALQGLEQVSHLWLVFMFHQALPDPDQPPRLRVRPPRLGGNTRLGVFATRSSHRPNGLGQSLVKIEGIEGCRVRVSGLDLVNGTPIVDIKPYVPYADCVSDARNAIASEAPEPVVVEWQDDVYQQAELIQQADELELIALVEQCLAQDPKPAYQTPSPERQYGTRFWHVDVGWHYPEPGRICINRIGRDSDSRKS